MNKYLQCFTYSPGLPYAELVKDYEGSSVSHKGSQEIRNAHNGSQVFIVRHNGYTGDKPSLHVFRTSDEAESSLVFPTLGHPTVRFCRRTIKTNSIFQQY
ncbi:hypothetical protein OTU49_008864 [Cherax quadricarinatus]|uniref:Uncharacterized protein n=1 Tax=Cherax quadricarinatus TaxID=27406 RepID=A0AAW0WBJ9_CHEQU